MFAMVSIKIGLPPSLTRLARMTKPKGFARRAARRLLFASAIVLVSFSPPGSSYPVHHFSMTFRSLQWLAIETAL